MLSLITTTLIKFINNNSLIKIMELKTALRELGLKENEIKIYLESLKIGPVTVGNLAKKTGLYRTYVYDILEKLIDLGLVKYVITSNKKHYQAEEPKKLFEWITEKEEKLKKEKEIITNIIPLLEKLKKQEEEHKAFIYRSKKGIKTIFEDQLEEKNKILVLGAQGKFRKAFPIYWEQWVRRLNKLKIPIKVIYNASLRKRKEEVKKLNLRTAELKFLPRDFDFPSTVNIWHNKVATILWTEQPFAFVIESKEVVKSYKNFFRILWKIAEE